MVERAVFDMRNFLFFSQLKQEAVLGQKGYNSENEVPMLQCISNTTLCFSLISFAKYPDLCMPMRVVITAATAAEWMQASQNIHPDYTKGGGDFTVSFHQSGVGMLASAVSLTRLALEEKPDLVIQAGIAGCFDHAAELGMVIAVKEDILGDTGVEEAGVWKDVFDLNLEKPNNEPFENRKLINRLFSKYNLLSLPGVGGITVNEITTRPERTALLMHKYNPFIESMEGAALHYVCGLLHLPFIQIRAVSNYIGERNKANWKIRDALVNLNRTLLEYIHKL